MKTEKSSPDLETEVVFAGLCAHCGCCGAFCPHIEYQQDGLPQILDACNETVGQCYNSCPRTSLDISNIEQKMFGHLREDESLGYFTKSILVKSKNSILNILIDTAFKHSLIDSIVVPENQSKKPVNNIPKVIEKSKDVPKLTSRNIDYTGPLVTGVNAAYTAGFKSVGLVGNPCHFQGIAKMQNSDFRSGISVQSLKIAIMCAAGGATGCIYCIDYAGEFSDISYSDIGLDDNQALLLIRTKNGQDLVDFAAKNKSFEIISESPDLSKIQDLANKKKTRNINNLLKLQNGKIGYLELNGKTLSALF
ncbi:MAG: Coenzyme F420 hydrogenase/dehydrogenase, beta subunit C-terminal domain [Candidatus Lokiarchaeota archaeon]|nr:Coenzyme F420 hydrogenase/dehydrogenase, beta subunit C-terminal domain [Candidatus Lokiarchaeota archaeon]